MTVAFADQHRKHNREPTGSQIQIALRQTAKAQGAGNTILTGYSIV
jgi:hypothetical protein